MTKEQFQRETDYGIVMALVKEMLENEVISKQDFLKINKMYSDQYCPLIGKIPSL